MYWEKYQDVVLLVFIVLSVFLTSWLDVVLVKLTHLDPEQKASVRLISVFYIVLILLYIRFIYEDTNYDGLILYFLTLTVGRFLYFDFTVKSFLETMRGVLENLPLLVIMSAYSGFVCWYGFHVGFLLKSNGVILSTFLAHLFMDCSIFLLHKTGILKHVIRKFKPAFFTSHISKALQIRILHFLFCRAFLINVFFTCQTAVQSHVRQKLPARRSHTGKRHTAAHLPPSSRLMEATAATHGV